MNVDSAARPLAGCRIVVTRSPADNRSLTVRFGELGAETIELSLMEVLPAVDGGAELAAAVDRLGSYRWVILTSVNGVQAVADALAGRPWPEGVTVAPIGPATEAAARSFGFETAAAPATATAESLVASFPVSDSADTRVLAPLAELAGDTVVDGLNGIGYSVHRVTAYRTAAPAAGSAKTGSHNDVADGSAVGSADAVAFFSPSVVDRFLARCGPDAVPPVVLCIGPSTAARAVERHLSGVVTADPHSEDGIIAAAVQALSGLQR